VLYMASFFYTLNYMWNLYTGIREKFYSCHDGYPVQFSNRVSTAGKTTALLSGVIPLLLMTPVFIQGNISQCQTNFSEPYSLLHQVFVVKARRIYRRVVTSNGYLGNQQRTSFRVMDRRMLLYPLVFILCWGPAVGLASLRVVKPSACQGKAGVVFYISQ
ncbi:transmembrane protein 116-like, partial [Seriola lalandi dorsalis]|uniref:transmembrane protein 116-like n=1 Tax=Seriola lalandi dorsalis TaxID=1841481 RepID=UPI000C6FBDE5